jgi:hypothetical protein
MPVTWSVTVASFAAKDSGARRMAISARATGTLLVFMPDTSGADYIAVWAGISQATSILASAKVRMPTKSRVLRREGGKINTRIAFKKALA